MMIIETNCSRCNKLFETHKKNNTICKECKKPKLCLCGCGDYCKTYNELYIKDHNNSAQYRKFSKVCEICGKEFEAGDKKARWCKNCINGKICLICGKKISFYSKYNYCQKCMHINPTKKMIEGHKKQGKKLLGDKNPSKRKDVRKSISKGVKNNHWSKLYPEKFKQHMLKLRKNLPSLDSYKGRSKLEDKYYEFFPGFERYKFIGPYEIDFLNEKTKDVIEIQGCYWHFCKKCFKNSEPTDTQKHNIKNDKRKKKYLEDLGYTVYYFWEHEYMDIKEKSKISISRELHFSAGHRVYGHESVCSKPHGHNYTVWIYARPITTLDELGRVVDFGVIKEKIKPWIDENWDHGFILYEKDTELIDAFSNIDSKIFILPFNPTAENLANFLLSKCNDLMKDTGIEIHKIEVQETERCIAYAEII